MISDGDPPIAPGLAVWSYDAPPPLILYQREYERDIFGWEVQNLIDINAEGNVLPARSGASVRVFAWPAGGPPGPVVLYDGPWGGILPGWNSENPEPYIMMSSYEDQTRTWIYGSSIEVHAEGQLYPRATQSRIRVFGWPDGTGPRLVHDTLVTGAGPLEGWNPEAPWACIISYIDDGRIWTFNDQAQIRDSGQVVQKIYPKRVRVHCFD